MARFFSCCISAPVVEHQPRKKGLSAAKKRIVLEKMRCLLCSLLSAKAAFGTILSLTTDAAIISVVASAFVDDDVDIIMALELLLIACNKPEFQSFRSVVEAQAGAPALQRPDGDDDFASSRHDEAVKFVRLWLYADADNNGSIDYGEVNSFMNAANLGLRNEVVQHYFNRVDTAESGQLNFAEFLSLFLLLTDVPELDNVFQKYAGIVAEGLALMSPGDMMRFFREEQRETEDTPCPFSRNITAQEFKQYLTSPQTNSWAAQSLPPSSETMSHPLKDYFIYAAHNTYLTGDQFSSSSSDSQMYMMALLDGVRWVEIDCWDGPDGDPMVCPGGTHTSKILFRSVIKTINQFAFVTSPFPLILSLGVHTSPLQQQTMASILKEILGKKLDTFAMHGAADIETYFTPLGLQGKVLINYKLPIDIANYPLRWRMKNITAKHELPGAERVVNEDEPREPSAVLAELVMISSVKASNADFDASGLSPQGILSLTEDVITDLTDATDKANFLAMNHKVMTRIYPKSPRGDSSNYDPFPAWRLGSSLVALNFLTTDTPMRCSRAMFLTNQKSGYVLKPSYLTTLGTGLPKGPSHTVRIKVISAMHLPKPDRTIEDEEVISPYVVVTVRDWSGGSPVHKTGRPAALNNGVHPVWKEETWTDFPVWDVRMGVISLEVWNHNKVKADFIAESTIPLTMLRSGYRCVELSDATGRIVPRGSVLLQIRVEVK